MADTVVFYGLNKGQAAEQTQIGTETASTDVEIRVNATKVASRSDLLVALSNLQMQIVKQNYPAA